jgi:hypothetical protein
MFVASSTHLGSGDIVVSRSALFNASLDTDTHHIRYSCVVQQFPTLMHYKTDLTPPASDIISRITVKDRSRGMSALAAILMILFLVIGKDYIFGGQKFVSIESLARFVPEGVKLPRNAYSLDREIQRLCNYNFFL